MFQRARNKVAVLRADLHMRELARGTLISVAMKVIGAGLGFGFNVVVARLLGAEGAGLYFLALAVTVTGSIIGRVGLDNTLLRFVATYAAREEWGQVWAAHALGMRIAVAASSVLALLGFCFAPLIAEYVFSKPELTEPLGWMCLSILPLTLLNLQAESMKGMKRIRDAVLVQDIGVPLFGLMLIWPLANISGIEGVAWAYFTATLLVAMLGTWGWRQAVSGNKAAPEKFPFAELWASCRPLFVTSLINRAILPWGPLFFLGFWVSSQEVGVFGAASRVAMLVSFLPLAINNVVSPKFAELFSKGNLQSLGTTARRTAALVTVLVSPLFILLLFQSDWVMGIYGKEFEMGGAVLIVLIIGQMVNVITGSVGSLLIMSGNESKFNHANLFALGLQIVLLFLLVPRYGVHGAALASALSVIAVNVISTYLVYRAMGITSIPFINWGMK
jgi:O-antigen/teichoic acid export membrane protein